MLSKDIAWIAIVSLVGLRLMSGMAVAADIGHHGVPGAVVSAPIVQLL